jgi:hypothetical protein
MESQGTTRAESDRDNVVHLPARDWLGPREELVPVGPSRQSDSPPRADDFWSEDSAALQDALQPPAAREAHIEQDPPTAGGEANRPRWRPLVAPLAWRRWTALGAVVAAVLVVALIGSHVGGGHAPARVAAKTTQLAAVTKSTHASRPGAHRASRRQRRSTIHRSARRSPPHRHVVVAATQPTPVLSTPDSTASRDTTDVASVRSTGATTADTDSSTGHPTGPGAPFAPGYIP